MKKVQILHLKIGYTVVDYQPRYSTNTKGKSIVKVSISKNALGSNMIKGTFASRSEIRELVEKVSKEKLEEVISRTKGYYVRR